MKNSITRFHTTGKASSLLVLLGEASSRIDRCTIDFNQRIWHGSECGLHVLGYGSKNLTRVVQEIRYLGIENLGFTLLKLDVGDQGIGKSSLVRGHERHQSSAFSEHLH